MQILHFDWLRYQGNISNSHQVAKFAGFSLFFFSSNKYFFNLHLLTLLLPFLSENSTRAYKNTNKNCKSFKLDKSNAVSIGTIAIKPYPFLYAQWA